VRRFEVTAQDRSGIEAVRFSPACHKPALEYRGRSRLSGEGGTELALERHGREQITMRTAGCQYVYRAKVEMPHRPARERDM